MFPHERSLVKRLADKPFALLGINSDPDLEDLKKKNEKLQIAWRSWWDRSTNGPIATAWNVDGWPTIYILDAKGTIRYIDVPDKSIDKAIDTLLEEMEKESKK